MIRRLSVAFLVLSMLGAFPVWLGAQRPAKGTLVVQSTPGGAQVYVDDTLMGTTSAQGRLRLLLKPGAHTLRLSHQGYGDWNGTVRVAVGHTSEADCALPPAASPDGGTTSASGPSLADTLDFIRQALASDGTIGYRLPALGFWKTHSNTLRSGQSCAIVVDSTMTSRAGTGAEASTANGTETVSLSLGDLNPSSVKVGQWSANGSDSSPDYFYIEFQTTNLVKSIVADRSPVVSNNGTTVVQGVTDQESGSALQVSSKEVADRIAAALVHAIELCGGRKSAF